MVKKHETSEELEYLRSLMRYEADTGKFYDLHTRVEILGKSASRGYLRFSCRGATHLVHRVAYAFGYGKWPTQTIDHLNFVRHDNRLCNLEDISLAENLYRGRCKAQRCNMVGKPRKPYLRADWKISLPAELASRIDLMLEDPMTKKPKYAARARLVEALLRRWIAESTGELSGNGNEEIAVPTLADLREGSNA